VSAAAVYLPKARRLARAFTVRSRSRCWTPGKKRFVHRLSRNSAWGLKLEVQDLIITPASTTRKCGSTPPTSWSLMAAISGSCRYRCASRDSRVCSSAGTQEIARRHKCSPRHVEMTIALAFLAPVLVKAAVEGRLPRGIGAERLRGVPADASNGSRSSHTNSSSNLECRKERKVGCPTQSSYFMHLERSAGEDQAWCRRCDQLVGSRR
jgi:hypothetical protein